MNAIEDEREAFEKAMESYQLDMSRSETQYRYRPPRIAWAAWMARAAIASKDMARHPTWEQHEERQATYLHLRQTLIKALKHLSYAAQTSGGTAGRDEGLVDAIGEAERALSLAAASEAIDTTENTTNATRLIEAVQPFAQLMHSTSGRIPTDRLSFANWHELTKAYDAATGRAPDESVFDKIAEDQKETP